MCLRSPSGGEATVGEVLYLLRRQAGHGGTRLVQGSPHPRAGRIHKRSRLQTCRQCTADKRTCFSPRARRVQRLRNSQGTWIEKMHVHSSTRTGVSNSCPSNLTCTADMVRGGWNTLTESLLPSFSIPFRQGHSSRLWLGSGSNQKREALGWLATRQTQRGTRILGSWGSVRGLSKPLGFEDS